MNKKWSKVKKSAAYRLLALMLCFCFLCGAALPAGAASDVITGQSAMEQTPEEQSAAEEPTAEQSSVDENAAEEGQPVVDGNPAEEEQPAAGENEGPTGAEEPAAEEPAVTDEEESAPVSLYDQLTAAQSAAEMDEILANADEADAKALAADQLAALIEKVTAFEDDADGLKAGVLANLNNLAGATQEQLVAETPATLTEVYVSSEGSDTGDGSETSPFATLATAVDKAADGAIIYLQSDLTMTRCARFYDKRLTIDGQGHTVTRGDGFSTQYEPARSWYNPAMIEVDSSTPGTTTSSLTLKSITLDDGGKKQGTHYVQAESASFEHTDVVQDAIIATYNNAGTITLESGTTLKNFGGMSAVRLSDGTLTMKAGSKICQDEGKTIDRTKQSGDLGAAGAIWSQGGTITMEQGASIENVVGRAIYLDGGTATVDGSITGIVPDPDNAWKPGTDYGIAVQVRKNSSFTLGNTGRISNINSEIHEKANENVGSVILMEGSSSTVLDGTIQNCSGVNNVLYIQDTGTDDGKGCVLNGTVEDCTVQGSGAGYIVIVRGSYFKVTRTGTIQNNHAEKGNSTVLAYPGAVIDMYGSLQNNTATQCGGFHATKAWIGIGNTELNIYEGAKITGNKQTSSVADYGSAIYAGGQNGQEVTINMYGGEISGNSGSSDSTAAVYVRKDSRFKMTGGSITNNTGVGVYLNVDKNGNSKWPLADITGGTITGNTTANVKVVKGTGNMTDQRVFIKSGCDGMPVIVNTLSITPDLKGEQQVYLGTAGTESVTSLTGTSTGKGWSKPLATFWTQKENNATYTVGGVIGLDKGKSVYILTQKTNENGTPADGATVNVYAATVENGEIKFTLPASDTNKNGCAIAIVQPTTDYGTLGLTGTQTLERVQGSEKDSYTVDYTATYTMSENLASSMSGDSLTVTITLDQNTEYVDGSAKLDSTTDFALASDDNAVGYDKDSKTLTVKLTKLGTAKESSAAKISFQATLPNDKFTPGGTLTASSFMTAEIKDGTSTKSVTVPSSVWETKMTELKVFTITATAGEGGSISPVTAEVIEGKDSEPFTITPDTGYEIESLTVNGESVEPTNSYTFTNVTANGSIKATFKKLTYTITATAGEGGSIDPDGDNIVTHGDDAIYTITPADGYVIESVTVDGESVEATDSYTFTNVTSKHTITVTFAKAATPAPAETATPTPTAAPTAAPTTAPTATAAPSTSSTATATPAPTAAPKATATPAPVVPQTGDEFPYSALFVTLAVAAAGFGYTFYRKKKDN